MGFRISEDEPCPRMLRKRALELRVVRLFDKIEECEAIAVAGIKHSRSGRQRLQRAIKLVRHPSHGNVKQQGIARLRIVQQVLRRSSPVVALNVQVLLVITGCSPKRKNQQEQESGRFQRGRTKAGNSGSDKQKECGQTKNKIPGNKERFDQ